ncbi:hypothetical protein FEP70_05633 [Burkholderia multivorans]|nr:hypothetical protein [Burkholderia multivorans]MDR8915030.1 hypothetical protein [Burkholderia multivorans]MDR8951276.1 hypothetical protein [Burkholderia multivorans]MDR8987683.1 hypothetical protein [Burkholderia multivorans]MDR9048452.1 hypothetical protein [Burkholderia multivorans]
MPDRVRFVGLDHRIEIALGLDPDLLRSFLVLEADRIGVAVSAALGRARQDPALRRMGRQRPRRHRHRVVDAPRHDRSIGIAVFEIDDHFGADPRNMNAAEVAAGPRIGHAHPAGRVLILHVGSVPMELERHLAVLVRPDLRARRARHDRRLRAARTRFPDRARRTKYNVGRLYGEPAANRVGGEARRLAGFLHVQLRRDYQILAVGARHRMAGQHERRAAHHVAQVALALRACALRVNLLHAHLCECLAVLRFRIVAGPFVTFELVVRCLARQAVLRGQRRARLLEIEIVGGPDARSQALRRLEAIDVLAVDLPARRVVLERLIRDTFHAPIGARTVDEHQAVHALRVFEEPRDAVLLHQPLGKREVRFAVLDLIPQRPVGAADAHLERIPIRTEHLAQNVEHALPLEDAIVGPLARQCQPGLQHDAVTALAIQLIHIAGRRHDAADFSRTGAPVRRAGLAGHPRDKAAHPVQLDRDGQFLAEHRLEIEVGQHLGRQSRIGGRHQPQFVRVRRGELFRAPHRAQVQHRADAFEVRQRRAADREGPVRLEIHHACWPSNA